MFACKSLGREQVNNQAQFAFADIKNPNRKEQSDPLKLLKLPNEDDRSLPSVSNSDDEEQKEVVKKRDDEEQKEAVKSHGPV